MRYHAVEHKIDYRTVQGIEEGKRSGNATISKISEMRPFESFIVQKVVSKALEKKLKLLYREIRAILSGLYSSHDEVFERTM